MVTASNSTATAAAAVRVERRWRRAREDALLVLLSVPLVLFLTLPLLALVVRAAPVDFLSNLFDVEVAQAIWLSMATTTTTLLLTLVLGAPVAYLLARRRFRGHAALDTLIDLPIVLPPLVAGIALLLAFGRGIGDAASVLFTAGYTDALPQSLTRPVASLPLAIFYQLSTPFPEVQARAYASALVLTILILAVSLLAQLSARRLGKHVIR